MPRRGRLHHGVAGATPWRVAGVRVYAAPVSRPLGELRRVLGAATGVAVGIGTAVGVGILSTPGEVAKSLPSAPWILGVWALGALIATLDVFILAEMASSVPRVGGLVAYVRLSFGPAAAFLVGWSMLLITWPASLAAVAVVVGEVATGGATRVTAEASSSALSTAIAVGVIAAIGGFNLVGLRFGARFEVLLLVLKVTLLAGVCIAAAAAAPPPAAFTPEAPALPRGSLLLAAFGGAMSKVVFSFDGYADSVYLAGETERPGRAMPRALFTSLLTVTGLYLLANITFLHVLGVRDLAGSTIPALDVARRAFGDAGSRLLTVVALVVMLGAINAYFLTGPRIARVLAEERLAVPLLGRMPASGAPVAAILWIVAVAIAFALTGTFSQLVNVTVPIITATTALVAVGLLVQRVRAPARERPFRVRKAPLVVGLQVAICAALLVGYLLENWWSLAIDAGALAIGLIVYALVCRRAPPGCARPRTS
jgi:APA family basic amino acid/polyamine antiporter